MLILVCEDMVFLEQYLELLFILLFILDRNHILQSYLIILTMLYYLFTMPIDMHVKIINR